MSDDDHDAPARLFTPAEANEVLPAVIGWMGGIGDRLTRARALGEDDELGLERIRDEIEALIAKIREIGVEVKGLSPALLDFPALHNGQQVYLCWKEGEAKIEWWHPISTGIAGRQRIDFGQPGSWEWCN
jgi:hypothetical protein